MTPRDALIACLEREQAPHDDDELAELIADVDALLAGPLADPDIVAQLSAATQPAAPPPPTAVACPDCGETTGHRPDCAARCPHCGSDETDDLDHLDGCPTIGTCAQTAPFIPVEEGWHPDPERWTAASWAEHMRTAHPGRSLHDGKPR